MWSNLEGFDQNGKSLNYESNNLTLPNLTWPKKTEGYNRIRLLQFGGFECGSNLIDFIDTRGAKDYNTVPKQKYSVEIWTAVRLTSNFSPVIIILILQK